MKNLIRKYSCTKSKMFIYLLIYLLIMFIIICYFIFIFNYILNINYEVVITTTTTVEKLQLTEVTNKSIIEDFFNKFTTKSRTIESKYFEMQLLIKDNQNIINKSVLDNIRSDYINSLVLECESYKKRIYFLEVQAQYTKMIQYNLINDLHEILKDVEKWRKE